MYKVNMLNLTDYFISIDSHIRFTLLDLLDHNMSLVNSEYNFTQSRCLIL